MADSIFKVLNFLFFGALGLIGLAQAYFLFSSGPPSDTAMVTNFEKNKIKFEQLVVMMREDGAPARTDVDFAGHSNGISDIRLTEFKKLFSELNLKRATRKEGNKVEFLYFAGGVPSAGSAKGYLYYRGPVESSKSETGEHGKTYKKIDDNWYIFHVWYS